MLELAIKQKPYILLLQFADWNRITSFLESTRHVGRNCQHKNGHDGSKSDHPLFQTRYFLFDFIAERVFLCRGSLILLRRLFRRDFAGVRKVQFVIQQQVYRTP